MKNHLLIANTNANKSKKRYAKKMLLLSLLCIFAVSFMTTASVVNVKDLKGGAKTFVISASSLALVPFAANVRGTKAVNGHDETEEEFAARKGAGESDEMFAKRCMLHAVKEAEAAKKYTEEFKLELAAITKKINEAKSDADLTAIKEELKAKGLEIKALQEVGPKRPQTEKQQIYSFIEKNFDKIKELKARGAGVIEFKVVGTMSTTSASNPDDIPDLQGVQAAPPSNVNLRAAIVESLVSTLPTSLASYPYTESVPKDGDYGFVAEKGSKPQIDFKIETRYAAPKKVAAYMSLSEESVTDIPGLQGIAYDFLRKKHDLKKQNGILFGDGTGANPKGATEYGRAFVAGDMANTVTNPNIMDVINACLTDIFTTHNYEDETPYMASLVLINPIDFFVEFVAAKDGFGRSLYPMASLFNRVTIGGMTILPFEDIPSGDIFVADLSKYNTTKYVDYTVRIGWINDDFIKNQFCIVGESRFHAFVKKLDEQAFIYDQIDDIRSAIQA